MSRPLGVYVHWPYCARICPYCDFNVFRARGREDEAQALVRAIVADLERQRALTGPRELVSIFLGGGTPSLMEPAWVEAIVDAASLLWSPAPYVEVTLEANPTDAEASRFEAFRGAGVNRLSLGVQALDDVALRLLGRNHGADEARRAARTAAAIFSRLSLDLIYARPDQTVADWAAELREAVALGAEHLSPYQLTIEPGTAFDRAVRRGRLAPPPEDLAAELYETTQAVLEAAGFEAYEVSNHARGVAARSRHNLVYWQGDDYVGVGPGAHGRVTAGDRRLATKTADRPADYIEGATPPVETLTPSEAAEERLLAGLRILGGVPRAELADLHLSGAKIDELIDLGLLADDRERLRATSAGRRVLDAVTRALLT